MVFIRSDTIYSICFDWLIGKMFPSNINPSRKAGWGFWFGKNGTSPSHLRHISGFPWWYNSLTLTNSTLQLMSCLWPPSFCIVPMHGVETGRSRGWTVARHQHSPALSLFLAAQSGLMVREMARSQQQELCWMKTAKDWKKKVFIVKVLLDPFWSQLERGAADLSSWHVSDCVQFAVRTVDYHHLDWQ